MSQVKIYGLRSHLSEIKAKLSDVIHQCVVEALQFPQNKRAHRFINLEKDDFYYPEGRTDAYIIIEFMMIEGRTVETKKNLIKMLFEQISSQLGISVTDIEICIMESPAANWGFRGMTGDEVSLNYKIDV
ncbi:tautomerase family protein [Chondrinema litorale]|uniref:tautomerase family protein n=1 Tax=Chondrinema litorale TaxID=2994555 RepID=UPI000C4D8FBD|nr:tautomerase family protein [Chondrinema litorale]MBT33490.1 tautomerase family protein [Thalassovita sp.]UZR95220.1 tautomerase family protein [Chondrinema litorale]